MRFYNNEGAKTLLDAINKENNLLDEPLILNHDVSFGLPHIDVSNDFEQNTRVTIYGLRNGNKKGSVEVYYHRWELENLFRNINIIAVVNTPTTLQGGLDYISKTWGIELTKNDITNQVTAPVNDGDLIKLTIKQDNLLFFGEVSIRFLKFIPSVSELIKETNVPVFNSPFTLGSKPNISFKTYSYDCSLIWDWVSVNNNSVNIQVLTEKLNEALPYKFIYENTPIESQEIGVINLYGTTNVSKPTNWTMNPNRKYYYYKLGALCQYEGIMPISFYK